jgi:hypothetical protein
LKYRILALTAATLIFGFISFTLPTSASASSGDFVAKINSLRASKGLPALSSNGSLAGFAQSWTAKMAAAGKISHNPGLGGAPGNWTSVGENVGVGSSVDAIFKALVNSPGHYANMVNPKFNSVGVGVVTGSDGRLYTTHNFAAYPSAGGSSSGSKAAPAAKQASKPAAKPSANSGSSAPKAATTKSTSAPTSSVAAPEAPQNSEAPAPEESGPVPSDRIVQSLLEVGSIHAQG